MSGPPASTRQVDRLADEDRVAARATGGILRVGVHDRALAADLAGQDRAADEAGRLLRGCPRVSRLAAALEPRLARVDRPVGLALHLQIERAGDEAADAGALVAMRQRFAAQVEV